MEFLTDENINPAFKRIKYGVRGWLEDRTHEIRQELARVSTYKNVNEFLTLTLPRSDQFTTTLYSFTLISCCCNSVLP